MRALWDPVGKGGLGGARCFGCEYFVGARAGWKVGPQRWVSVVVCRRLLILVGVLYSPQTRWGCIHGAVSVVIQVSPCRALLWCLCDLCGGHVRNR